jgi:quinoprotein glucose dehydrogenase
MIPDNEPMLPERCLSIILRGIISRLMALVCAVALLGPVAPAQEPAASDWGYWGGDAFGRRYSALHQIDRGNVDKLRIAWSYRTGELGAGLTHADRLGFEATPVLAFGLLYLVTPTDAIIALEPTTGRERWRFDPRIDRQGDYPQVTARGVAAWSDPEPNAGGPCRRRLFVGTLDGRLLAVDAEGGHPCAKFGRAGVVALPAADSGDPSAATAVLAITSPPVIYRDTVIVGALDTRRGERGTIRAFDARSGAVRWTFESAAPETAAAAPAGVAPSGALTLDPGRGILFVPTGGAVADVAAVGAADYPLADALLCLDASTGKLLWSRQLVHHDLWNSRLAAPPSLIELDLDGESSSAVIEATREGMLFVFDRESGVPVFPVIERRVPVSHLPGVLASATQPFSTLPALAALDPLVARDAWGLTFWDRNQCRARIAALRNEGAFTPPGPDAPSVDPGPQGGVTFGGIAFDPVRERVITAVNRLPFVATLVERAEWQRERASQRTGRAYPQAEFASLPGARFGLRREPLRSSFGFPCTAPPWGTLVDVDLKSRRIVWQVPLGSTEGLAPAWLPVREFGMPNLGGPVVTAGNLVFIGAAADAYLRAFDVETGRELWKHRLPAGGMATPMTYVAGPERRQFVVIAAGGSALLGAPRGDWLVAFALPAS